MGVLVYRYGEDNAVADVANGDYWESDQKGGLIVFQAEGVPVAEFKPNMWDYVLMSILREDPQ